MEARLKFSLFLLLCTMCVFICIGYAAFSDSLDVVGEASALPPECIYITNVSVASTSNIDKNDYSFISGTTNIMNNISRGDEAAEGVVIYEVTVYNNTRITYYYRDNFFQTGLNGYNGNDYISIYPDDGSVNIDCRFEIEGESSKKIMPYETRVFYVVYTVGSDISPDIDLNMLVNIRFGIHVSGVEEAIEMIENRFLEILNTQSTYEYLVDVLDNKYDGYNDWTSNYVGNVGGATEGAFSDDSVAVNTLFQNQLLMTIDGELKEVTVIIKHENIDWDTSTGDDYVATHPSGATQPGYGCEMTLYLTIDQLDEAWAYVPVYAMVFTCDRDWQTGAVTSQWYRVGNAFIGRAEVSDYDGTVGGTGSFRTTTWYPEYATYELIPGYHFEIPNGTYTDQFDLNAFDYSVSPASQHPMYYLLETWNEEAPAVILQMLNDAYRILDNEHYAGEGIDQLRAVYEKYYWIYGYTGQPQLNWPYPTVRKFYPAMIELYNAIMSVANDINSKEP